MPQGPVGVVHIILCQSRKICPSTSIFHPVFYSQVPLESQNKVLWYGILGAVVMRAIFIALGEVAMNAFHPVLLGFAGILLISSYKLLVDGDGDEDEDLTDNKVIGFASKALDATDSYQGDDFFSMVRTPRRVCTQSAFRQSSRHPRRNHSENLASIRRRPQSESPRCEVRPEIELSQRGLPEGS